MSLILLDGCDVYDSISDASGGGWSVSGSSSGLSTPRAAGRFGGGAFEMNTVANSLVYVFSPTQAYNQGWYYGVSVMFADLPSASLPFLTVGPVNLSNYTLRLTVGASGRLYFIGGTVAETATTAVLAKNTWYRIEFFLKLTANNTNTGILTIRVNGNEVFAGTGLNLRWNASALEVAAHLRLQPVGNSFNTYFDDIVVNDDQGSINNGFLGDVRIDCIRPSGDGSDQAWTPNTGSDAYATINDTLGVSDGDSSFIFASAAGSKSDFAMTNLAGISSSILGVQMRAKAKKTDAGAKSYKGYIASNGHKSSGNAVFPGETYGWASLGIKEVNPDGDVAWNDSSISALEFGVEVVS